MCDLISVVHFSAWHTFFMSQDIIFTIRKYSDSCFRVLFVSFILSYHCALSYYNSNLVQNHIVPGQIQFSLQSSDTGLCPLRYLGPGVLHYSVVGKPMGSECIKST